MLNKKISNNGFVGILILLASIIIIALALAAGLKYYSSGNGQQTKSPINQAEDARQKLEDAQKREQELINKETK